MKMQRVLHGGSAGKGLWKNAVLARLVITLAALGLLLAACGVKGPPVPPRQLPPPAVTDLSYRIENGWARLTWSQPKAALAKGSPEIVGFVVYRSKTSLKDPCKGCPLMFQRIARVSPYTTTESKRRDTTIGYADKLEKGYRYVYKVVSVTANNVGSEDSNLVEFNYGEK